MDAKIVAAWDANKSKLRSVFEAGHPQDYKAVVTAVVKMIHDAFCADTHPDPERVHEIDDGDHQGTLVYVIGEAGYQPDHYWYVKVAYGSCSGCDTLEGIRGCTNESPTKSQVDEYMTLALHIVQGLRQMGAETA